MLRTAISKAIKNAYNAVKDDPRLELNEALNAFAFYSAINNTNWNDKGKSEKVKLNYRAAMTDARRALEAYPRYGEYLCERVINGEYQLNGAKKVLKGKYNDTETDTYVH